MSEWSASPQGVTTALDTLSDWPSAPPALRSTISCGDFHLFLVEDMAGFSGLWPPLGQLDEAGGARSFAFQRRDHLDIWLETIGTGLKVLPKFVSVSRKNGEPIMLLPLGIEKRHGLRVLKFLDGGVADYNAPVIYPGAAKLLPQEVRALWAAICKAIKTFDFALLEKMPEYVGELKNPLYHLAQERWHISGHYLRLRDAGTGLLLRKPNFKESRRKRRRLSEKGEVSFRIATGEAEIQDVFGTFVRQKSRRYMETLGMPGFDVPGQKDYYLKLAQRLPDRGVQLAYLCVGDEIVATAWNLIAGRRLYYMMAGYEDGGWRRHSPGWLLLEELVGWSSQHGIEIFDFGIGDESYKLKWQETEFPLWSAVFPRTILGWSYCAAVKGCIGLKKKTPRSVISLLKGWRNRWLGLPSEHIPAPSS
jgi:CelD/BcsL family acetyltransferase involved in cellulose biosynthesis